MFIFKEHSNNIKFLLFASYVLKIPCPPYDYTPVANILDLPTFTYRKHNEGIRFIKCLLNDKIKSSVLV